MPPSRRTLLRTAGVVLSAGTAGCLSSGPLLGHPEVREETGQTVERTIHAPLTDESADPAFATLVVGRSGFALDEKKPHQVWMRNEIGERREFTVELSDAPDADSWFRRKYDFERESQLVVELRTPRKYALTVRNGGREETIVVPKSRFDCNDSATDVIVRAEEIETTSATTDMGCGGRW